MKDIVKTFDAIDYTNGKPHLLISNTTKGRGVSFMEGIAKWHHGVLNEEQCKAAVAEIELRIKNLEWGIVGSADDKWRIKNSTFGHRSEARIIQHSTFNIQQ